MPAYPRTERIESTVRTHELAWIDEVAEEDQMSRADLVRRAVLDYLNRRDARARRLNR